VFELLVRVLCDVDVAEPVPAAYLFAQTADNQQSVFETGLTLSRKNSVDKLLIPDSEPMSGYPGFLAWQQQLLAAGLPAEKVAGIPTSSFSTLHTLIEAKTLVNHARTCGINRLFIIAPPFHQLRAFITTVSVLLQDFSELRVYNRVGKSLPWNETVVHSQGTLQCQRSELIQSELDRIERYRQKGDLAPEKEILNYLKWRDR
jgi:hypothetical protein